MARKVSFSFIVNRSSDNHLTVPLHLPASQSSCSGAGSFFDFASKRDLLKNFVPASCMPDDEVLHSILRQHGFDVERTANALMEQGAPKSPPLEPPHEPMQMDRVEGSKRARTELPLPPRLPRSGR
jgi:hypothetical protein